MENEKIYNKVLSEFNNFNSDDGIYIAGKDSNKILNFINRNSKGKYNIKSNKLINSSSNNLEDIMLEDNFCRVIENCGKVILYMCDLQIKQGENPVKSFTKDGTKIILINENSIPVEDNTMQILNEQGYEDTKTNDFYNKNISLMDDIIKEISPSTLATSEATNGTATVHTNVYAGPSDSIYASIGSIGIGEGVIVLGTYLDWYHIRYFITNSNQEKTGYVPKSYIFTTASLGEEDFYGEFCYAKNNLKIKSTQNFDKTVSDFGSVSQYEGMTLLYSYAYAGTTISFVEYSTSSGTKRGYVYESEIVKPLSNKSCVLICNARKVVYSGPDFSYAELGAIGNTELSAILAKEGDWLYVEYNTIGGRKRGYITTSDTSYYHRPSVFPDFFKTTKANIIDYNAWVTDRQDVYGGPNTTYANIGAVNNEKIINYKTNSGSNEPLTYIEYWITGSSQRKCGYIATSSIITKDSNAQPAEKTLTTITGDYNNFKRQPSYGKTQLGREMYYYKAGTGSKHFYLIFAHHGWEEGIKSNAKYFAGDGDSLIRIAKNFIERFEANPDSSILSNWSIYVFPGINLDGIVEGVGTGENKPSLGDNGSFGRCLYDGYDPNRNWAGNFIANDTRPRYKTGSRPFISKELQNLRDELRKLNENSSKSVLLDIHGWLNQTVGNMNLGQYFWDSYDNTNNIGNTRISKARSNNGAKGDGYLINWAKNPTTLTTDPNASNQAGLGADACLIELIQPYDFSINKIENQYGLQFYNAMIELLKKY